MTRCSDEDVARLWLRQWLPAVGLYAAPAAVVQWDGATPRLTPTGQPLSAEAALIAPALARSLAITRQAEEAALVWPTIACLLADYATATASLRQATKVAPVSLFSGRLSSCRRCVLWCEGGHSGRGRCDSVGASCSRRPLWRAAEACPESLWSC